MESATDYFSKHEEQAFIGKALLTVVAIIMVREYLSGLIFILILLFPVIFLVVIRLHAAATGVSATKLLAEHITFMPVMRTEKEELRRDIPFITYIIIMVNILVFYMFEVPFSDSDFIEKNLIFLPTEPNLWNVPLSAFTSMFLHASNGHLWGNMTFLWMLGTAVERRVGGGRFLSLYLITGLVGGLVYLLVDFLFLGKVGHALGASGAIAGIMGIFAVRCYFKSMVFPLPILGIFSLILPISLKVRLNSLVIIGLFFLSDLSGGIGQAMGEEGSMVAHWCHLGGMISGMLIAMFFLKLGTEAMEERHLEAGMKAAKGGGDFEGGERSLRIALEMNPDNPDALLALARLKSRFRTSDEGRELYEKAISSLIATRPQEAASAFKEYYGAYLTGVQPELLLRLAGIFGREHDLEIATRCLEMVVQNRDTPPHVQEKALFQGGMLLERMGLEEAAEGYYRRYIREFPHADAANKVRAKLGLPPESPPVSAPAPHAAMGHPAAKPASAQPQPLPPPPPTSRPCPACGRTMAARTATNASQAGKRFWVCQAWPECKNVIPFEQQATSTPPPPKPQPAPSATPPLVAQKPLLAPRIRCPKCGYQRKEVETAPEWQCPACQVVYAKARPQPSLQPY